MDEAHAAGVMERGSLRCRPWGWEWAAQIARARFAPARCKWVFAVAQKDRWIDREIER